MSTSTTTSPAVHGEGLQQVERLLREAEACNDPVVAARLHEQAVLHGRALAVGLARRFERRGVDRQDLEQVALLGLVQAVRRYRPGRGNGFAAFATPTITGEIKRHFRDHGWAVRPPRALQERHLTVSRTTAALTHELGREPSTEDVAAALECSTADVREARAVQAGYRSTSFDSPLHGHEHLTVGDTLVHREEGYDRVEQWAALRPVLARLSPRERLIVRLRFVDELTQRQIGQQIGVSQMQVSRLLSGILRALRAELTSGDERRRAPRGSAPAHAPY